VLKAADGSAECALDSGTTGLINGLHSHVYIKRAYCLSAVHCRAVYN